jgi:hypothetical protein
MTNVETIFDYKTTINISFDIDNYNEEDIIKIIKEKFNIIKQCKTEDIDETIAKAQAIEDFDCDCYACISGSNKLCVR